MKVERNIIHKILLTVFLLLAISTPCGYAVKPQLSGFSYKDSQGNVHIDITKIERARPVLEREVVDEIKRGKAVALSMNSKVSLDGMQGIATAAEQSGTLNEFRFDCKSYDLHNRRIKLERALNEKLEVVSRILQANPSLTNVVIVFGNHIDRACPISPCF